MTNADLNPPSPGQCRVDVLVWLPDGENRTLQVIQAGWDPEQTDRTNAEAVRDALEHMAKNTFEHMTRGANAPSEGEETR